ncbi:MAG: 30S ribosomal protein S6 [Christensenellaceae bacterium]|nr:30S ribosomal protein S6 [Christensenellaceae bacterium]
MNSYEALYVIKPDMEDEAREALIQKFAAIVTEAGGEIEGIEEWGKRKLAYPINYIGEGYYVLMNFKAKPELPAELERNYKISEDIMRYMVIRKEEN